MTDLPRDDDQKRADPAIAATYKIGAVAAQQHPTDPISEHSGDADRYRGGEFSSPLDPDPAPAVSRSMVVETRPLQDPRFSRSAVFDGLEPAVTRIGECYPGAAAAARGTGRDAMGGHINGSIDHAREMFARPLDFDFDSDLLRQLDERERLGSVIGIEPKGGHFTANRADVLEADYQRELRLRRAKLTDEAFEAGPAASGEIRDGAFGVVEREVMSDRGPIQLRSLGRPVPARNSAPPYSWMADQERYEDSATAGLDADYRAQVRASRLWVGFAGLALVVGLLAIFFYRQ